MVLWRKFSGARRKVASQVNPVANLPTLRLRNGLQALVVDVNMTYLALNSGLLTFYGVGTRVACGGLEAIEILSSSGMTFDIVVVELSMPEVNGCEVAKRIRRMGFRGVILGISLNNIASQTMEFLEAGGNKFMMKPLSYLELAETLIEIDDKLTAGSG